MDRLKESYWDQVIQPKRSLLDLNPREVWRYRDLLRMLIKRDIITVYKQTILGPAWYVLQPVLTSLIFVFIFGKVAKLSTDGLPMFLFYLAGITMWNYFADSWTSTSGTFRMNAQLFGKVYFPRVVVPLSKVIGGLVKFMIQLSFLVVCMLYYLVFEDAPIVFNWYMLAIPLLILISGLMGLGLGTISSALTAKYRDISFLIDFGVRLFMYATPVIYPLSSVPPEYQKLVLLNPMTSIVEAFKFVLLGSGSFDITNLLYSAGFALIVLVAGMIIFNRTEQNFMDTV